MLDFLPELFFALIFFGIVILNLIFRIVNSQARRKSEQTKQVREPLAKETEGEAQSVLSHREKAESIAKLMKEIEISIPEEKPEISPEGETKLAIPELQLIPEEPKLLEKEVSKAPTMGGEVSKRAPTLEKLPTYLEGLKKSELPESIWKRIQRYPDLQKAIILSEILYKPKGLQF